MFSGKVQAILVVAAAFTVSSSESAWAAPRLLTAEAACKLAHSFDEIPGNVTYSIEGIYRRDYHHAVLEVPSCDLVIMPSLNREAAAEIDGFHYAFREKCNSTLINDRVSGVFTGTFVAHEIQSDWGAIMENFFVISSIDSKDLDIALFDCPKQ